MYLDGNEHRMQTRIAARNENAPDGAGALCEAQLVIGSPLPVLHLLQLNGETDQSLGADRADQPDVGGSAAHQIDAIQPRLLSA